MSLATSLVDVGRRTHRGVREITLLGVLYAGYSVTRTFADQNLGRARDHAVELQSVEQGLGLNLEGPLNQWLLGSPLLRVFASYWYASLHYVVTAVVLVWLYRRSRATSYLPARRALVLASLAGLACYLLMPLAPPRFMPGYIDILHVTAPLGWWGADASAPRGLGGYTNELAAFPSLHAGWALWVALVVTRETRSRRWRTLAWAYAVATAAVIVGTGNHWILDVVGGWAVVLAGWFIAAQPVGRRTAQPAASRASALRTSSGSEVVHIGGSEARRKAP